MRMQFFVIFLLACLADARQQNVTSKFIPQAYGWSGGWCLATVAEAGWIRSASLNPTMAITLALDVAGGYLPMITGSASGGSTFAIRYLALRLYPIGSKFTYPCYLLPEPYRSTCFFHSGFGAMASDCESDAFNVINTATFTIYSGLIALYGGPLGVASLYLSVYFPFLAGLPLKARDLPWNAFVSKYTLFSTIFGVPSNLALAYTRSSPKGASQPMYNYGYDSYLSRSSLAYSITGSSWVLQSYGNTSVTWITALSANAQTGFVLMPFALASKNWDEITNVNAMAPAFKLFVLIIQFLQVKKLSYSMQILSLTKGVVPPSECSQGCPSMDGGFSDNGPLTPVLSAAALVQPNRPSYITSIGAFSTMTTVKYLMGSGPLGVTVMLGVNVCPFTQVEVCTLIGDLRLMLKSALPDLSRKSFDDIGNVYQVYRPAIKLIAPYCGDPLTYDLFEGQCAAEGVCDMWSTVLPSKINAIPFSPDVYVIVFVMAYLKATPVSARFTYNYIPQAVWSIPYYSRMDAWFPNFDAMAKEKGGMGFTHVAGNSMLDFMTYLNIRLVGYLTETKASAGKLSAGLTLPCFYQIYKRTAKKTFSQPVFLSKEKVAR